MSKSTPKPSAQAAPPACATPPLEHTAQAPAVAAAPEPISAHRAQHQRDVSNRLRRIEGQVRALVQMIEDGRPCEDIAQQMAAARKALDKAFYRMMACSMMEAAGSPDATHDLERSTRILEKYA
ncbi:MAG: metal-sensing transcriptional repressor [Pseudomonadota bacterium]|jgi:DNA-binding FrmR family transcriptional regulator